MLALATMLAGAACSSTAEPAVSTPAPGMFVASEVLPPQRIDDFALTDQDGAPFRLSDTAGKVRVLYFGYTSCPDICPTTLWSWKVIKRNLGPAADDVRFIMVTVDPEVDVPAAMKRFVELFDTSFIGLGGSVPDVWHVWHIFDVHPQRVELTQSATGHSISHSTSMYVLDADGMLRLKIPFTEKPEDAAQDILRLMGRTS